MHRAGPAATETGGVGVPASEVGDGEPVAGEGDPSLAGDGDPAPVSPELPHAGSAIASAIASGASRGSVLTMAMLPAALLRFAAWPTPSAWRTPRPRWSR